MKTVTKVSVFLLAVVGAAASVHAQGAAFTYQGHLNASGSPVNGSYDLTFSVWDADSGPSQIGSTQAKSAVPVANGLFTVVLDFGAGIFTGAPRWLEIGGRPAGGGLTAAIESLSLRAERRRAIENESTLENCRKRRNSATRFGVR